MSNMDAGPMKADEYIRIILSSENWETKRQEGGEMVAVAIAGGRGRPRVSIKMLKSEAVAKGLYPEESTKGTKKSRKAGRNKMRAPAEDK